jgi:hypothetical protein
MHRSSEWPLPFRISDQNFGYISHPPICFPCSVHLILLYLITLIIFEEKPCYKAPHYAVFLAYVIFFLLGPNILLSTALNTLYVIYF